MSGPDPGLSSGPAGLLPSFSGGHGQRVIPVASATSRAEFSEFSTVVTLRYPPSRRQLDRPYLIEYTWRVYQVRQTDRFREWLAGVDDRLTRIRLGRRLEKVQRGSLGDVAPVGEGVFELREDFGPGWRMYFVRRGRVLIVMLGGGTKRTQGRDIAAAKRLAAKLED